MELKFNLIGKERKPLVEALSEILGQKAEYQGAPTYGYNIGEYNIDKESTVTGEYNLGLMVALTERGFEAENTPNEETPDTMSDTSEAADNTATDRLSIEYPLDSFTQEKLDNLKKLVESKDVLIKAVLGISELPIQILTDRIAFPWFPADSDGDTVNAYAQFITALCNTAKKKSRIVAKAQESFENPRFTMRVWLIGLGLTGKEYDLCRKLMMNGLSGNSGFRYGKPENCVAPRRDGIHREVISIQLTPDTLEKLTALAAKTETETGQRTSRNMLIEQAVEVYIQEAVGILENLESANEAEKPESTGRTEFTPEGDYCDA